MSFVAEASTEVDVYNIKWQALLDHVHLGIPLHDQVRDAILAWGKQVVAETKIETDPEERYKQVQAKVAALSTHFAPVLGEVTVWSAGLKPLMEACAASLDGLPLFAAVDGVHSAFSRAENARIPDKPGIDLLDADSLERRARWLHAVGEVMVRVESGPREIGAALRFLEETLKRFNQELDSAKGLGRKGNVSCLRWNIPLHPIMGQPEPRPRQPVRVDPYAKFFE